MKKIFFDTEFTDLGLDPRLISLGCVSECGLEFYRELKGNYELKDCGDFTVQAVLPHLNLAQKDRLLMHELSLQLGNWIEGFEEPQQIVTDSLSCDWPWMQEIFSDPGTWPANLDGKCVGLHEIVDSPFLEQMKNAIWRDQIALT